MSRRIALLSPVSPSLPQALATRGWQLVAEDAGPEVVVLRSDVTLTAARIEALARGGLRLVVRAGTGLDNIDLQACYRAGVEVSPVPGVNAESVAEVAAAMALVLLHRLGEGRDLLRVGRAVKGRLFGRLLAGRSAGIVGLGATGRATLRMLRRLGVTELTATRATQTSGFDAADGCRLAPLAESLAAELVFLHVPLTPATRHLVNASALAGMRRGALLINLARREVLDAQAVAEALDDGRLGGLATDVADASEDAALIARPNVFATPHLGANSAEAHEAIAAHILALLDARRS